MTFNNYFTNIGSKLANKIGPVRGSYLDYIKARVDKTIEQHLTNLNDVFHSKKCVGFGNFSPKPVKAIIFNICTTAVISFINHYPSAFLPANLK